MTGIFGPGGIIFFPGRQERTSTVVLAAVLLVVGVIRRRPLHGVLATLAWIAGFEAAWQFTIFHFAGRPMGWPIPGSIAVVAAVSLIVGVEWRWLAVAAATVALPARATPQTFDCDGRMRGSSSWPRRANGLSRPELI